MAKIEIHIITYNEQVMLPFTIAHYKKMFGNPTIVIHDNNSTDDTVNLAEKICKDIPCTLQPFTTEGMNDTVQSNIKSQAALNATSDWVLCIDADEECLINSSDLDELDKRGVNIVRFEGWNIFDQVETPWDVKSPMGVPCIGYSKPVLIKTGVFSDIQFAPGAHDVTVIPKEGNKVNWSNNEFKLLHYKHWSCKWNINRSAELAARQSEDNKQKNHSFHFALPIDVHESYFKSNYEQRQPIIDKHI